MDNQAVTPFGYCPAQRFSVFSHMAQMPYETDAKKI